MRKAIRRIYFRLFKRYRRIEYKVCSYSDADALIRQNDGKPANERWDIAPEEDINPIRGVVWIERKERILE